MLSQVNGRSTESWHRFYIENLAGGRYQGTDIAQRKYPSTDLSPSPADCSDYSVLQSPQHGTQCEKRVQLRKRPRSPSITPNDAVPYEQRIVSSFMKYGYTHSFATGSDLLSFSSPDLPQNPWPRRQVHRRGCLVWIEIRDMEVGPQSKSHKAEIVQ